MLPSRALLTILIGATLVVAGCLGGETAEDAPESGENLDNAGTGGSALLNETETAPVDDGTSEMAEDLGHQPHLHDYWHGRERVTLIDEDLEPDFGDTMFATFYQFFLLRQPGKVGGAFMELPDGKTVFEGTGQLEVTVSWTDPTITGMGLRYRSAAGPDYSDLVPLQSGSASVIEVTPEMTDMPHMSTSRWRFQFFPSQAPGAQLAGFHVKIDIVKMRDISLFPGHPELFEGQHEKVILDADGKSVQQNLAARIAQFATSSNAEPEEIAPEKLVPMETQSMKVELDIKSTAATVGTVSDVYLYYHGADSGRYLEAERLSGSVEEKRLVFALPVEMKQVDSPYGKTSQWGFIVFSTTQVAPDAIGIGCGACVDSQVEFHIKVTAYDRPLDTTAEPDG